MRRAGAGVRIPAGFLLSVMALLGLVNAGAMAQDFPFDSSSAPVEILSFDATYDVAADGTLHVIEDIRVQYNTTRRGIIRTIPLVYDLDGPVWFELPDGEPSQWQRLLELDDLSVTSASAPDDVQVTRPSKVTGGTDIAIRIGEEDTFISGEHSYRISYTIKGSLNRTEAGTELYWNVTGNGWDMPIRSATAAFTGAGLSRETHACFQGGNYSSLPCTVRAVDGGLVMSAGPLQVYEGMTSVVVFDPAQLAAPDPILRRRWTPLRALYGNSLAIPLTVLTTLLAFGGLGVLMWRQGRDRVARGAITVDGRLDHNAGVRRPLGSARVTAVEFRPPDDLRPAELGLVVDERVDPVDISATVVDLAVRGFLTITEVEKKRLLVFSSTDWKLTKVDRGQGSLLNYEQMLMNGLFSDGDEVSVGDLKGSFAEDYQKVQRGIYEQGRKRGWFNRRPDKERTIWLGIGGAATFVSTGLALAAFFFTEVALATVPFLLAGLTLMSRHDVMPHRTVKGSDALRRTLGFREFIETAEAGRMEFAEKEHLFVDYLPYAVVFGATEKWAKTFADLGVDTAAAVGGFWYGSHVSSGQFDARRFSDGLADFSNNVGTSLSTVPSSSGGSGFSGGFSGGGMGGGGGSSW